jgi:flagellar biosynthesis/type III secretory pathway M-ring protein FliF/YscJ
MGMFSKEMIRLLIRIISSWQVIAVTVVFILYVFLVSYVARLYRHPRAISMFSSRPKSKKAKAPPTAPEGGEGEAEKTTDDELGLEEG